MQLHVTSTSPFARMARIAIIEKALEDRVSVQLAATRQADSPYYEINASGRVPCLVRDNGPALESSELICAYLDSIGEGPQLAGHPMPRTGSTAVSKCWHAAFSTALPCGAANCAAPLTNAHQASSPMKRTEQIGCWMYGLARLAIRS